MLLSGLGKSCPTGRVWYPALRRCLVPGSEPVQHAQEQGTISEEPPPQLVSSSGTRTGETAGSETLSPTARQVIEGAGHSIDCRTDPNWFHSPAGGEPAILCAIDGGKYEHAAYMINRNPAITLATVGHEDAHLTASRIAAGEPMEPTGQPHTSPPFDPTGGGVVNTAGGGFRDDTHPGARIPADTAGANPPPPAAASVPALPVASPEGRYVPVAAPMAAAASGEWLPGVPNALLVALGVPTLFAVFSGMGK